MYTRPLEMLLEYARAQYGTEKDTPFSEDDTFVLRRADTGKWFAVFMRIKRGRLGLDDPDTQVWVVNVKPDPVMLGASRGLPGCFPAYHMSKAHWLTALLDGTAEDDLLRALLSQSYEQTGRHKSASGKAHIDSWIIPANPAYYDIQSALADSDETGWKKCRGIRRGDTVYMYVCAPVSAILYRFKVTGTDEDSMRMKVTARYEDGRIDRELLAAHGVRYVRGPRGIPNSLKEEIDEMYR